MFFELQHDILRFFTEIRNPVFNTIFEGVTIVAEPFIMVFLSALIYWCINKTLGKYIILSQVSNLSLNEGLKNIIKAPRPFDLEGVTHIRRFTATGYSFPSGHTQSAMGFWFAFFWLFKHRGLRALCIVIVLLTGISRVYLGLHWPVDVLFGWIFGALMSFISFSLYTYAREMNQMYGKGGYIALVIFAAVFLATNFFAESEVLLKTSGLVTGAVIGIILEEKYINFETRRHEDRGEIIMYIIKRMLLGLAVMGAVYALTILLKMGASDTVMHRPVGILRYVIVASSAVALVPYLFKRLNI